MGVLIYLFKHKWLVLISFLILFGIILNLVFQFNSVDNSNPTDGTSNISPTPSSFNGFKDSKPEEFDTEDLINPKKLKGLQKTENLKDGNTLYTLSSSNPARPNIIIAKKNGDYALKRIIIPVKQSLSSFIKLYEKPKWIFNGSVFYGPDVQHYIYADLGFSLVANPKTDVVLEEYLFQPIKIDEYIKKYGDDIPAQP